MANLPTSIERETLVEAVGVPVPDIFVRAINLAFASTSDLSTRRDFFSDPWNWLLPDQLSEYASDKKPPRYELRYDCTPAEVFPFATMGVDGVHYGFVVHDPSIQIPGPDRHNWPIAQVSPMDSDDCFYIGRSFADALWRGATQISTMGMGDDYEARARKQVNLVHDALGLHTPASTNRPLSFTIPTASTIPKLPNYLLARTTDRIGVFAPICRFRGGKSPPLSRTLTPHQRIEVAIRDLRDGFAASALVHLRDAWHLDWIKNDIAEQVSPLLVEVYKSLGREALADAAHRREMLRKKRSSAE